MEKNGRKLKFYFRLCTFFRFIDVNFIAILITSLVADKLSMNHPRTDNTTRPSYLRSKHDKRFFGSVLSTSGISPSAGGGTTLKILRFQHPRRNLPASVIKRKQKKKFKARFSFIRFEHFENLCNRVEAIKIEEKPFCDSSHNHKE